MRIILDTNFLIDLCRFHVDLSEIYNLILEPIELYVVNDSLNELKSLSKNKFAKLALKILEASKIKVLSSTETNTDKAIIELADRNTIVATNDAELRKQLKQKKVKTIYLRARKHLAIS